MKYPVRATMIATPELSDPLIRTAAPGESCLAQPAENPYNKYSSEGSAGNRHYCRGHRGFAGTSPNSMTPPSRDRVGTF